MDILSKPETLDLKDKVGAKNLGIIGCGAIVQETYLPIFLKEFCFNSIFLVDPSENALTNCKKIFPKAELSSNIEDIIGKITFGIIASPHKYHYSQAMMLLENGIDVLIEKPMCVSTYEAKELMKKAREENRILAVGLVRRFYPAVGLLKKIIGEDSFNFGKLKSLYIREGGEYTWPTYSGFFFNKALAGGGVLIDSGAHALDLLFHWLSEYPSYIDYSDDNYGGVESTSMVQLKIQDISISIFLTRLGRPINIYKFDFEGATVFWHPHSTNEILIQKKNERPIKYTISKENIDFNRCFTQQIKNFIYAVFGNQTLFCPASEAYKSIRLIEECYNSRKRIEIPGLK